MLSIRSITIFTVAAVAMAASTFASAQNLDKSYAIKVGASYVQTKDMVPNDTWLALGAEVKLPTGLTTEGETRLSLDYSMRNKDGETGSITSLTLNQYFPLDSNNKTYVGVGFGPYWLKPAGEGAEMVIGARVSVGTNITDSVFAEANYNFTDKVSGRGERGDALVFSLGYRL